MKSRFLPATAAALGYLALSSAALQLPIKRTRQSLSSLQARNGADKYRVHAVLSDDSSLDLNTVHDLIYIANVTVGDVEYPVQLDTGSSDLWLKGDTYPLPNSEVTTISQNVTYGIGWANGSVAYASASFANISVTKQAFLDAYSAENPALGYGANGILGLGFTSLSTVDKLVNDTGSDEGRCLLYNMFEENHDEPNFISFALHRGEEDSEDEVEGSFTIGEYVERYRDVANQAKISTFPVNSPKRWNVLVDAIIISGGDTYVPTTKIPDAPANRAVALLDSGTSYSYTSKEVAEAIYGSVSGASYDASLGAWSVPCDAEIDMAVQIGGQVFPVHPLDVTPRSLSGTATCIGSFVPQEVSVGGGASGFDMILGDNFLRAVYSIYDFGDFDSSGNMGNPYVQLLSLIDPNEASQDFAAARGTQARSGISYSKSDTQAAGADSTSVTLSSSVAKTLDTIGKFLPAMLGVVVLNLLVLMGLLVFAIVYFCKRKGGRGKRRARDRQGRAMDDMPMAAPRNSYVAGSDPEGDHQYQPVSMAITEDTLFARPSGQFGKMDANGSPLKNMDRPMSLGTLPSAGKYQSLDSDDHSLMPPSPSYTHDTRPKSVGFLPSQHSPLYDEPLQKQRSLGEDEPFTPPAIAVDANGVTYEDPVKAHARSMSKASQQHVQFPAQLPMGATLSPNSPSERHSIHRPQGSINSVHSFQSMRSAVSATSAQGQEQGRTMSDATLVEAALGGARPRAPTYAPPAPPMVAEEDITMQPQQQLSAPPPMPRQLSDPTVPQLRGVQLTDRPRGVSLQDRPMSAMFPGDGAHPQRRPIGVSLTDRPMSAMIPHSPSSSSLVAGPSSAPAFQQSNSLSPPPQNFRPPQRSPLRGPSMNGEQRPMSVFTHSSSAGGEGDASAPPQPAFRRPGAGSGSGSGDRPMSVA